MSIPSGTRLGPHEIVAPLGAGGMGEVYRARDTRLGRDVAIKVLPDELTASEDLRQRFEREARTISRLTHPHICTLFDVGREGAVEYLVMELLEGETLAERLAKGRLPLEQVLRSGGEIAAALAAAHALGIVHRDLKPANIMLTRSGIKLLDFGLAKVFARAPEASTAATVAVSVRITGEGMRLGTAPYMAPEQAEGKVVDARADVFALGAVLFEMATGVRAFAGTSQAAVLSAVLNHDPPPVSALQPAAPPSLDRLVRRCLAKDPAARWNSTADLELQLREIADVVASGTAAVPTAPARRLRVWLPWAIAGLAVASGAVTLGRGPAPAGPPATTIRFVVPPPTGGKFAYSAESPFLAVSPDGSQLAFLATDSTGVRRAWLRPLAALEARPMAGTENASSVFWSPDGRSLGFFAGGKLARLDLAGGAATPICEVPAGGGMAASWGRSGDILFSSMLGRAIHRVPASGGDPRVEVTADSTLGQWRVEWPWFLPDGRRFLYLLHRADDQDSLMFVAPGERPRAVCAASSNAAFTEPDLLTFVQEGTLLGRRFDWRGGRVSGGPFPIADPVRFFISTGGAAYAASAGGTLVYQSSDDVSRLVWIDRGGRELGSLGPPGDYLDLSLSPDRQRLLCARTQPKIGSYDVWSLDLARGTETRLTSSPHSEFDARLLPGGRSIAYSAAVGQLPLLYRLDLETGESQPMLPASGFQSAEDISPDGKTLAYVERTVGGAQRAWALPLDGKGRPAPLLPADLRAGSVRFSPDGRYLAFLSDESGQWEAYVAPYPGPGEMTRVSRDGALELRWPSHGGEILYLSRDRKLVSVPVRTLPALSLGTSKPLFTLAGEGTWNGFDVTPDGQRILAIVPQVVADRLPITVIANWPQGTAR